MTEIGQTETTVSGRINEWDRRQFAISGSGIRVALHKTGRVGLTLKKLLDEFVPGCVFVPITERTSLCLARVTYSVQDAVAKRRAEGCMGRNGVSTVTIAAASRRENEIGGRVRHPFAVMGLVATQFIVMNCVATLGSIDRSGPVSTFYVAPVVNNDIDFIIAAVVQIFCCDLDLKGLIQELLGKSGGYTTSKICQEGLYPECGLGGNITLATAKKVMKEGCDECEEHWGKMKGEYVITLTHAEMEMYPHIHVHITSQGVKATQCLSAPAPAVCSGSRSLIKAKCNAKRNASCPTLFCEKENRLKAAE
ncbi:hypothetical protein EVAR_13823_1 [Eumeta japonica]|uniref:Uncharacterized protein n=1 Tax=Eumeta variegata TaxID=151549 RepID=A0A4C1U134_EUMVA|nr:hypothetical protein EVAR_13823_1 [Eumeta japonica]